MDMNDSHSDWAALGDQQGLIPRVLSHLFERIEQLTADAAAAGGSVTYRVRCVAPPVPLHAWWRRGGVALAVVVSPASAAQLRV